MTERGSMNNTRSYCQKPQSAVYRPAFLLPIVINDKLELGRPQLDPVPYKRYSATGAEVVLKGQFMARVQYAGTIFELLVTVSNRMDTRSLMGRRWFPTLNLDWNGVFHCTSIVHPLKKQTEQQRLQELQMTLFRTSAFYIQVKVEGFDLLMMFDTGAAQSKISSADWEKIGKPELKPTQIAIRDTSNTIMPLSGQCTISCEYNEQKANVPVLISSGQYAYSVIGTDWFRHIKFDFNKIFENVTFKHTSESNKPRQITLDLSRRLLHPLPPSFPLRNESMPLNAKTGEEIFQIP